MKTKHTPTIQDVAKLAGVSITTVSHVLHGKSHLYADTTVKRVTEASQSLHYHPNSLARSLAQRRSHTLGVVILQSPVGGLDFHISRILSGIFEYTAERSYQIKLIPWQRATWETVVPHLEDASIDGALLFVSRLASPLFAWAEKTDLSSVCIGTLPPEIPLSCVDVDHETAIYDATRELIAQGHCRIGLLHGETSHLDTPWRKQGYLRAFQEANLTVNPQWIMSSDYNRDAGRDDTLRLLDACPDLTALLCPSDRAAIGAMEALRERGLSVPGDISVIGFNDMDVAQYVQPPLTTLHKPLEQIGRKAAEILIRQIEGEERRQERVLLPGPLILRATVGPPPA